MEYLFVLWLVKEMEWTDDTRQHNTDRDLSLQSSDIKSPYGHQTRWEAYLTYKVSHRAIYDAKETWLR